MHSGWLGPGEPEQENKCTPGGAAKSADGPKVRQSLPILQQPDSDLCGKPKREEVCLQGKILNTHQDFCLDKGLMDDRGQQGRSPSLQAWGLDQSGKGFSSSEMSGRLTIYLTGEGGGTLMELLEAVTLTGSEA